MTFDEEMAQRVDRLHWLFQNRELLEFVRGVEWFGDEVYKLGPEWEMQDWAQQNGVAHKTHVRFPLSLKNPRKYSLHLKYGLENQQ